MAVIELPGNVVGFFDYIEGDTLERKISNLVDDNLLKRLRECEEEIYKFEVKYRMPFPEFKQAWEKDEIPDKYSHRIERDYMVWEGLEVEKKKWLSLMKRRGE
ncbi:hypothetical protein KJ693_04310 [bacterium]|nr:hypothetical protein [bacterium]MBU1614517.1 hypothetical protein [bacterium]